MLANNFSLKLHVHHFHETKNMNHSSSFLIIFLLLSHFFPYSSSSTRIMIQLVTETDHHHHHHPVSVYIISLIWSSITFSLCKQEKMLNHVFSCQPRGTERDHVQRKALHEVQSGPNPISNSVPQQKLKSDTQKH